ncbi:thiolase C-terminal domain-containing protein [Frankia gtarii]|uniref:thiolase C-terminal domain-containing protein n=1 Tax=Frankia gtarii TaxID=2950102 RepID=UPI0021C19CF1|nr:lipid-transfer protein [Frankia gtarii]
MSGGWSLRDQYAISGVGATDFSRDSGRTPLTLACEASLAAIADAGLAVEDIDGVVRADYDSVQPGDLAHGLGLPNLRYWGTSGIGGAAPCGMVGQAVAAVAAGLATNIVVFRALNGRSGLRLGRGSAVQRAASRPVGGNGGYEEFFLPYGLIAPGQMFALLARRHMAEFGTAAEDLRAIALVARRRANANPAAQMCARPLTEADYEGARMISEPLRLFDFCLETDGACAVVVTSTERALDGPNPPALVRAVAQGSGPRPQAGTFLTALMRDELLTQPSAAVAELLYQRGGLGPADIDVAQLYDCFTITVLLQLEDYGFCAKGEGGPFASSGALDLDGSLPFNTAGGNLSEGYLHGMSHVLEGVRQIRGTSTSQVTGARTCLVTSGIPAATSALLLRAA